jgi:AmmeMemoRadiSam system protein A
MEPSHPVLDDAAKRELLSLARSTLAEYLASATIPEFHDVHPELLKRSGAFVSLHNGDELRGCIGLLSDEAALVRTVQRCVLSAALEDTRFHPVTSAEMPDLKIEVSVLSPLRRIKDVQLVEVGKHGLAIALGGRRGLLLPQVAAKYDWDRETFLAQTCRKSGLPPTAWREPNAVIEIFEAQVFSE